MKYKQISKILSLGFIVLIMGIGIMAVRAQDEQPTAGYTFFFPAVDNSWHIISGQVLSHQNVPIAGVTIKTDHGQSAITDQNGEYALKYLTEGTYSLTPYLSGVAFSPNSSSVVVPPDVIRLNFTADVACSETLVNGGFEGSGGWEFPTTEYTAGYDTSQAHNGSRAARTGITNPADDRYSYSSTRQVVSIPSNTTSAYLTFWIKPYSGSTSMLSLPAKPTIGSTLSEVPMAGDVQYVLVLANDKTTILDTLVWQLSDSRTWTEYSFNLTTYKGKTIWLHFGTYNDGYSGVSSMFVDDVSVELCPGGGSPTPSPTPGPCSNLFLNPSFETSSAWEIPITEYSAGYSSAQKHTGSWSMRTGITTAADNRYSFSDFRQSIRIPSYTSISKVGFWLYTQSGEAKALTQLDRITPTGRPFNETILSGDLQYVLVLDQYQNWIDTLVWQRTSEGYWHYYEFDLRRFVGTSIYLQFGTYNDGVYGITSMYVDDVSLYDCVSTPTPSPSPTTGPSPTPTQTPTITPTPTNTPTPGPCSELIVNNNFDGSNGWEIPITAYSAGYSNSEYHSAFRSMRTGIVNAADNRWSYSDFRQTVGIPWNANHVTLGMWMLPISGEVLTQALPPKPAIGSQFTQSPMSGDVQYLLVMDVNYNILDVLSWQLSDSETWINKQFDMSNYRGWTILLQWGTYNNGGGGISAMYVDDVTLQVCP